MTLVKALALILNLPCHPYSYPYPYPAPYPAPYPVPVPKDYPKLLPAGAKVGFTTAPSWLCYSPCKNNTAEAVAAFQNSAPPACAYTAESDSYFVGAELLRRLGANLPPAGEQEVLGIPYSPV